MECSNFRFADQPGLPVDTSAFIVTDVVKLLTSQLLANAVVFGRNCQMRPGSSYGNQYIAGYRFIGYLNLK